MQRWDIINKIIEYKNAQSYIEIGYYKGWSFDNIRFKEDKYYYKVAVDPNPSKIPAMEEMPYGTMYNFRGLGEYDSSHTPPIEFLYKLTSDDFFKEEFMGSKASAKIFFIDGLHEYSQVYKDIENCLKNLVPGGVIILHDMNPPLYEHTTSGIDGCWTGDAYKAFLEFQANDPFGSYITYVVDTDWGVGVIEKAEIPIERIGIHDYNRGIEDWEYFDKNRKDLLNLISVEEFNKKMLIDWGKNMASDMTEELSSTLTISKTCNDGKPFDYPESFTTTFESTGHLVSNYLIGDAENQSANFRVLTPEDLPSSENNKSLPTYVVGYDPHKPKNDLPGIGGQPFQVKFTN